MMIIRLISDEGSYTRIPQAGLEPAMRWAQAAVLRSSERSHRGEHGSVISVMAAVCLTVAGWLAQKLPVCLTLQGVL
jgi:hypothetical protein